MKLKITVHGVAYEVDVEVLDAQDEMQTQNSPLPRSAAPVPAAPAPGGPAAGPAPTPTAIPTGGGVVSPIAGTVLEIKCKPGDQVSSGQTLLVIEAMKMETEIAASEAGVVKAVPVAPGDAVRENQMLVEFE
jgi:glutaconyl-CoA/methylmalonyl-CoA decarboxylase subunit gamma